MTDTLRSALYSVSPEDRDTWVEIGMALKSELGDGGFALWDGWSRQSERYKAADARSVWRSIKADGGITIATLYHEALSRGWQGEAPVKQPPTPAEQRRRAKEAARAKQERRGREDAAASRAVEMLMQATWATHPYLTAKGFPQQSGLVLDDKLLVPMRHHLSGDLQSVQMIDADGNKLFLPGGVASATVFRLGPPRTLSTWYCEGYATALSIQAALAHLYRQDQVVCVFMASNLPKVTNRCGYVIADHDANGVGQKYAEQTDLPWWMPEHKGWDANDVMLNEGVKALATALRGVMA